MRRKRPLAGEARKRDLSEGKEILSGMKDWRQQHPKATMREIEEAVDERLAELRAGMVEERAGMSAQPKTWTPFMTTRGLREHLHEIGLESAFALYGELDAALTSPRPRKQAADQSDQLRWPTRVDTTGYSRGSTPIAVTKAGGWKGNSAMVARSYGELSIVNEDSVLER